jgi:hypothetical protein
VFEIDFSVLKMILKRYGKERNVPVARSPAEHPDILSLTLIVFFSVSNGKMSGYYVSIV